MNKEHQSCIAVCRCGQVEIEATGTPIVSAACYCRSCQEAGARFEQGAGAPHVLNPDGGTDYALFRKDRLRCVKGDENLEEHRLTPEAPTRRVVASCCNVPMFLEFNKGHWLSIYRDRLPDDAAPIEMRVMTRGGRDGVVLPDDLPNYATHGGGFMWKLLFAWAAMGFRAPKGISS